MNKFCVVILAWLKAFLWCGTGCICMTSAPVDSVEWVVLYIYQI